jgi:site-specific DNA recombinase
LKRLFDDIDAGRVQMVVIYKIDRLTRSLADFAKLVERLEVSNCSFVSVTQAFNTSSSMGRLTLNVLLSFAQFEREVTAERIRDKISASKQKGLWMGGICPIGYDKHPDPQRRTLIPNDNEAETVKRLFELYDQHGCLRIVEVKARELGLTSKRHTFATGRTAGGRPFSRGQIYYILRNPIYIGDIRHKDKSYPGQHPAIVEEELRNKVQEKLARSSQRKRGQRKEGQSQPFLLAGKLWDETGDRLTPTSTNKGNKTHRYYVSNRLISNGKDKAAWRLSAGSLEQKVADIIAGHLELKLQRAELLSEISLSDAEAVNTRAFKLTKSIRDRDCEAIESIVVSVRLLSDRVEIQMDGDRLAEALGVTSEKVSPNILTVTAQWQIKKRGVESKIIIGEEALGPDRILLKHLNQAHQWVDQMRRGNSLKVIADKAGVTPAYIRARAKLALLSPKVQGAIISCGLDPKFTTNHIMGLKIPMDWSDQETLFFKK